MPAAAAMMVTLFLGGWTLPFAGLDKPATSLGIGNTPPTLFYGPGVINMDFSLAKTFRLAEGKTLEFRAETFNTFNHFNPSNPNTGLTYTVVNATPSSFGVSTYPAQCG